MLTLALLFAAGLVALVAGAEALVRGASRLALGLGVSPLVVGLTVVAFGTSAPEMTVSVSAAIDGQGELALGNAVGSNIFNVLFILGLAAVITPLSVHRQVIRQEAPILIGAALLVMLLAQDGRIGALEGGALVALLLAYTTFLVVQARRDPEAGAAGGEGSEGAAPAPGTALALALVLGGLVLLVGGSKALVHAAVGFAQAWGVSEVVIGLTVVAAGTSLPEVAASVMAARRGERDIAVGNVVGSCVFNLLGVIGLGALAADGGLPVPTAVARFDLWVMLAATVACLPVFMTGREVARWEGGLFLAYHAAYTAYLILRAQEHAALPVLSSTMMGFVIPLTVVTLVVSVVGAGRPTTPAR